MTGVEIALHARVGMRLPSGKAARESYAFSGARVNCCSGPILCNTVYKRHIYSMPGTTGLNKFKCNTGFRSEGGNRGPDRIAIAHSTEYHEKEKRNEKGKLCSVGP